MNILEYPIKNLKNCKPSVIEAFYKKNLKTVQDLIEYFPKRYEDRSNLIDIQNAWRLTRKQSDFITTIIARCIDKQKIIFRSRQINKFIFSDYTGNFSVPAFNPYLRFQINQFYILSGKTKQRHKEIQLFVNEYEVFDDEAVENLNLGRIVPIYGGGENLSQKIIRNLIHQLLISIKDHELTYALPQDIITQYRFPPKKTCFQKIHFPEQKEDIEKYKYPLIYEEFYSLQKLLAEKKQLRVDGKEKNRYPDKNVLQPFLSWLTLKLTHDQEESLQAIIKDLTSPKVMSRMLQGDVGTGKTLVGLISMLFVYLNGYQTALMVPTEILASQHYQTFSTILNQYSKETNQEIKITLLTGGMSSKARDAALWNINEEEQLIIIGTHTLIQKNIRYKNLKYIIIDEQQRFGVEQRDALIAKGTCLDVCSMTATPIPRSLFISFFGDLDVSVLKEKPISSSQSVITDSSSSKESSKEISSNTAVSSSAPSLRRCKVLWERERNHAYKFLIDRIKRGEQGYVVFPVIEENTQKNLRSLLKEYEFLKTNVFKSIPVGFIHGKVSAEEKQHLMEEFRKNHIKVLLATTVLEVGIDHPNATTMIIESSHQFGLSQLHQLRGRIGRGNKTGYCYLIAKEGIDPDTLLRLQNFCSLEDGFQIAELDLKIRGPGDLTGIKQSGIPPLKIGSLTEHYDILIKARKDVYALLFPQEEIPIYFTEKTLAQKNNDG